MARELNGIPKQFRPESISLNAAFRNKEARDAAVEARRKIRISKQKKFLEIFERTGNVDTACQSLGISKGVVKHWRDRYPIFARKFLEVREGLIDNLEGEAYRRAMEGSDRLIEFLLKSLRRSEYMEQIEHTHVYLSKFDDEVQKLIDELSAQAPIHGISDEGTDFNSDG